MIKRNFILIFAMIVVVMILVVSGTPIEMAALLGLICVIPLIPGVSSIIRKDNFRKVKAALYSAVWFTLGLYIYYFVGLLLGGEEQAAFSLFMLMILVFSLLGNFLYGLPVSIIAEGISMKFLEKRKWVSGFIHVGFGGVTYFYDAGLALAAVCCSVLFFLFDERIRRDD